VFALSAAGLSSNLLDHGGDFGQDAGYQRLALPARPNGLAEDHMAIDENGCQVRETFPGRFVHGRDNLGLAHDFVFFFRHAQQPGATLLVFLDQLQPLDLSAYRDEALCDGVEGRTSAPGRVGHGGNSTAFGRVPTACLGRKLVE
jgi:hypothetical protein